MSVNDVLATYEERDFADEAEALAAIAHVATAINEEWASQEHEAVVWTTEDRERRLREWLERLVAIVKRVVTQFAAISYAITVGFPLGVSVSITFSPTSSVSFMTSTS